MQRKVNVVEDLKGNKIVFIHDIRFKGRQAIDWDDVERYLKQYVGESHIIESTKDMCIFRSIGNLIPLETG